MTELGNPEFIGRIVDRLEKRQLLFSTFVVENEEQSCVVSEEGVRPPICGMPPSGQPTDFRCTSSGFECKTAGGFSCKATYVPMSCPGSTATNHQCNTNAYCATGFGCSQPPGSLGNPIFECGAFECAPTTGNQNASFDCKNNYGCNAETFDCNAKTFDCTGSGNFNCEGKNTCKTDFDCGGGSNKNAKFDCNGTDAADSFTCTTNFECQGEVECEPNKFNCNGTVTCAPSPYTYPPDPGA